MIKNKYVIDDFGNGEVVQKSPDAFEKQKQIAAKRKKQRSATQPPARTSGNTTTAKTPKTVGITGATGPEHERSYTVTGLNSSDAVYREQMKTSTAASAPPAKTNTSLQPAANTKPADVPQPQATPAPAPGRGNSMTSKLHLTEEDTARLLAEAREELAAEGLSSGSKKTKKQQSADPESIDPETLLPDWFETKSEDWGYHR